MIIMKHTENLYNDISDKLENSLDLFLININLDSNQKEKVIEFINKAFIEGNQFAINNNVEEAKLAFENLLKGVTKDN